MGAGKGPGLIMVFYLFVVGWIAWCLTAFYRHHAQAAAHHIRVLLAAAALLWGLVIAQPFSDAFAGAVVFQPMIALSTTLVPWLPATSVWGGIAALVGGLQLLSLTAPTPRRVRLTFALAAVWWAFVFVFVTVVPVTLAPATAIYPLYAAGCAFVAGYEGNQGPHESH